jgi:hypothetical protein
MTLQAKRALEIELQAKRALELEEQREKEKKEIQQAVAANLQIFREQHAAAGTRIHDTCSGMCTYSSKTDESPYFPRAEHSSRYEDNAVVYVVNIV